uniref:CAPRICE n=1 Tax=Gossypium hirsutum TaxID=3635 RepID=B7TX26_GOSHI|nr:CAPRICE [Gossypium hirsutum]ACJ24187.1 CAPRICE [Gossypium hirsutum]ACJ24189.1 CAPRICE [Gossypium hirsutum]ACJ24191.1 CAPRICE [Gossypium hirsutum]
MADSQHSSSGKTYVNSQEFSSEEETNEESKLKFSEDEETLIIRMFNLVGERWALIAGRIPGRTAEEIEEYWNTRYSTSE